VGSPSSTSARFATDDTDRNTRPLAGSNVTPSAFSSSVVAPRYAAYRRVSSRLAALPGSATRSDGAASWRHSRPFAVWTYRNPAAQVRSSLGAAASNRSANRTPASIQPATSASLARPSGTQPTSSPLNRAAYSAPARRSPGWSATNRNQPLPVPSSDW
jgi:hypothetical protein